MKNTNLKKLTVTSLLIAVAYLCVFLFRFKVSFLTFDFKDAILSVIAFLYGPIYGVASAVIVALMELIMVSDTGIYGFIMNALSSATFTFCCGTVYKYRRTLFGAVSGAVLAVLSMTFVMLIANIFITPFYMGAERSEVIKLIPSLLLPFNLIKGIINAAVTMIIYKPITAAFKKLGLGSQKQTAVNMKSFSLLVGIAAIIGIISILIIVFVLNGNIEFL